MTAVRSCKCVEPGKVTDHSNLRPPTDVMVITSLPQTPQTIIRSPVALCFYVFPTAIR